MLMASPAVTSRIYSLHGFKVAITVAFFSTLLLPKSDGSVFFESNEIMEDESKMVIGSKPPACVNKCMNCRPCMATVVVHNHHQKKGFKVLSHGEDDRYYLLSWKCRCGNKLFQP
ncbi:hypothetical protein TanjilG_04359 [Lupinus angustifolius]|uniref:Epidermal patterning factor-like protein n=1 Tax=Lupinus angustifolius TaxID=3871 RepID=A0A4P1RQD0_LUPAN|nr:PREDICTED: EPIDERMAL PATTERNING FACTOR-like protein 8 [Lupinus angustifolius]OIW15824.1 hypothetical protein TanjilG_04359 [Lupinus angustifolius]